jgi:galactokinase
MTSSGRNARTPSKGTAAAGGGSAGHRRAMRVIVLATVAHMLRSRRFYARLITVVVAVRALGQIGHENEASTMARLTAWDKRQVQRLERKAQRQVRAIKGSAEMARSGGPRQLGR